MIEDANTAAVRAQRDGQVMNIFENLSVGDENCCPTWKPAERVVTMETRRKEEERWRKECPEIKKCAVLIHRLETLLKPKQKTDPRPKTESSYCRGAIVTDTLTGQSKCARRSSRCTDGGGFTAEKKKTKNPTTITLKKVGEDQWVLKRSKVREEKKKKKEEKKEEVKEKDKEESSSVTTKKEVKKRRSACRNCPPCLREDCGRCIYCQDMKKFGGRNRLKQRCNLRRCLMKGTLKKKTKVASEESVTTAITTTVHQKHQMRRWKEVKKVLKEAEKDKSLQRRRKWGPSRGGKRATVRWKLKEADEEAQANKRRTKRKQLRSTKFGGTGPKRGSEEDQQVVTKVVEVKEEEEELNMEAHQPQLFQFELFDGQLLSDGLLTGTHIQFETQLHVTLDSSHFVPSILSNSTLAIDSQSGALPQDVSVLQTSTGLTAPPLLLQPKEEGEEVEMSRRREEGSQCEEEQEEEEGEEMEQCRGGVTDRGKFYDMEVSVPAWEEETPTLPSSPSPPADVTDVPDDVTASAHTPPKSISLMPPSFTLFGNGVRDEVTCGRGLLRLLQVLKMTVLPAHWVPVLAEGPLLQLVQCSRLSNMADTIIHIEPDCSFFISVHSELLPDTHTVYRTHTPRITHRNQLVSLLLELELLTVCRGATVRRAACLLKVRAPDCHLLVAPPCSTCLPCLLQDEEEEEEDEDSETEAEEDDEEFSNKRELGYEKLFKKSVNSGK